MTKSRLNILFPFSTHYSFAEEDEPYPELFDDVPSPLLIAATGFEKPYYRMVTLLCHHGGAYNMQEALWIAV